MQGMKQPMSILTSVTMAVLMTACSYSDMTLEEQTAQPSTGTVAESIPITLCAPTVRTETTVTRAAAEGYVSNDIAVWCLPTGTLGETEDKAFDMTTADIPLQNVTATISSDNTLTWTTEDTNYYYPATDARYTFYAYQPASGSYETSGDGKVDILVELDGKNNILWSKSETPTTDASYAYSEAYWQRNHSAAAPRLQTFKHIMAAVTVKVTTPKGSLIAGICLEKMPAGALLNLKEGTIEARQDVGTRLYEAGAYDLFPTSSLSNEAENTFYVLPQESKTLTVRVEYYPEGATTHVAPTYTTPATTLEPGKEYTITINIPE